MLLVMLIVSHNIAIIAFIRNTATIVRLAYLQQTAINRMRTT